MRIVRASTINATSRDAISICWLIGLVSSFGRSSGLTERNRESFRATIEELDGEHATEHRSGHGCLAIRRPHHQMDSAISACGEIGPENSQGGDTGLEPRWDYLASLGTSELDPLLLRDHPSS
jgi:hypothetical protein